MASRKCLKPRQLTVIRVHSWSCAWNCKWHECQMVAHCNLPGHCKIRPHRYTFVLRLLNLWSGLTMNLRWCHARMAFKMARRNDLFLLWFTGLKLQSHTNAIPLTFTFQLNLCIQNCSWTNNFSRWAKIKCRKHVPWRVKPTISGDLNPAQCADISRDIRLRAIIVYSQGGSSPPWRIKNLRKTGK